MHKSVNIALTDPSRLGEVRRLAADMARSFGFDETQTGRASIVATEAAGNILKHAGTGELILRRLADGDIAGLEILAVDKGPGMQDVSRCVEDGYSTAGSSGTGLGAIKRLSAIFDVYSQPGKGTALISQLWATQSHRPRPSFEVGVLCLPKEAQTPCGDDWAVELGAPGAWIAMADGLGHGPLAARAADEAVHVFKENLHAHPIEILEQAHGPLRATRGAGMSVAEISLTDRLLRYAGVGNIAGVILDGRVRRGLATTNGTVGHEVQQFREFTYPWPAGAVLVLHTDGLSARWNLDDYPGLIRRHPALIAGVLYRDFRRTNDDATVLVARVHT